MDKLSILQIKYVKPNSDKFATGFFDVKLEQKNNNYVLYVNKDYYFKHRLYINEVIFNHLKDLDPKNLIITSNNFIYSLNKFLDIKNEPINLHLTKSVHSDVSTFKQIGHPSKIQSVSFENNILSNTAMYLAKNNILFKTLTPYTLLDLNKVSGDNGLYSFSDYFYLNILNINRNLNNDDLDRLEKLFSFNNQILEINLHCSIKCAFDIISSYVEHNSKYSMAKVNLYLDNLALSNIDDIYLIKMNTMLSRNHSNYYVVVDKERLPLFALFDTISPLKEYASRINNSSLSTIEKLILINDYAKSRPYKDSENKYVARRLISSLNTDYVVCYTYAKTFKCLCDLCNIKASIAYSRLTLKDNSLSEHAKVICDIKDEKYGYSGILQFEPTNDSVSKRPIFVNEKPLDNYLYFANTLKQVDYYNYMKTEEFGLLKLAQNPMLMIDPINIAEASRQINQLYGTNETPYLVDGVLNPQFKEQIQAAIERINNSSPLTLDIFTKALTNARELTTPVDDNDVQRIININRYKCLQEIMPNSENIFENKTASKLYLDDTGDDQIISFEEM